MEYKSSGFSGYFFICVLENKKLAQVLNEIRNATKGDSEVLTTTHNVNRQLPQANEPPKKLSPVKSLFTEIPENQEWIETKLKIC